MVLWNKIFWLVKDLMTCLCLPINGNREREREKDSGRKRVEGGRKGEGEGGFKYTENCVELGIVKKNL